MPLAPGSRIGPYEVLSALGSGGMGEVYRARDPRLQRDVALKTLPDAVAADPDRLARFEREAKLSAGLNHPHVATLYGLEEIGGVRALVMELVEGPTLGERMAGGRIPLEEILLIALQMSEALEAAHERGVIHRDLKPANVKLTAGGAVKVLDFGLGKALAGETSASAPGAGPVTALPTVTSDRTQAGIILGTAAYMSPEQAKGRPADRRSDIWSFGVVLYECLTGRRLFAAETVSETLASVIRDEPDFGALAPGTPPRLRALLERCLVKDPRRRLQAIGDARVELEDLLHGAGGPPGGVHETRGASAARRSLLLNVAPWGLAAAVTAGLWMAMSGAGGPSAPPGEPVRRVEIQGISVVSSSNVAISPDGSSIVSYDVTPGAPGLLRRRLDSYDVQLIQGTEAGFNPFFSPDGRTLGFFSGKRLCVVPLEGGVRRCLAAADGYATGSWGEDGTIVFQHHPAGSGEKSGLMKVPASGGTASWLTEVARAGGELEHRYPQILPGGRHVLLSVYRGLRDVDTAVVPLAGGEPKVVLPKTVRARYVPTGHLVYVDGATAVVRAVPFDLGAMAATGPPVDVVRDIYSPADSIPAFEISAEGTLLYSTGGQFGEDFSVVRVDRSGLVTPLVEELASWTQPRVSPDGRTLLLRRAEQPDCHLWLLDLERKALTRLTMDGDHHNALWVGDGAEIAFSIQRSQDRVRQLFALPSDGGGAPRSLAVMDYPAVPGSMTPDGRYLAVSHDDRRERNDIDVIDMKTGQARAFLATEHDEDHPDFSPDGRWVAYTSNETGRAEVYVRPFQGSGAKYRVSTGGGTGAVWSRDGRELFYAEGIRLMRAVIATQPRFTASTPEPVVENAQFVWERVRNYDVTSDGRSFVMIRRAGSTGRTLRVVSGWFTELRRMAPGRDR
ncbi:MAG TPA: protein kinase [Candidatus Polarisedimenticolia bacterium]|nr:protein kinase [Candidatus Polarisedimenticolia bacterium]